MAGGDGAQSELESQVPAMKTLRAFLSLGKNRTGTKLGIICVEGLDRNEQNN